MRAIACFWIVWVQFHVWEFCIRSICERKKMSKWRHLYLFLVFLHKHSIFFRSKSVTINRHINWLASRFQIGVIDLAVEQPFCAPLAHELNRKLLKKVRCKTLKKMTNHTWIETSVVLFAGFFVLNFFFSFFLFLKGCS